MIDARVAEMQPLVDRRHGQALDAGGDQRARHGHVPVTVRVRLDDRDDLGAGSAGTQGGKVGPDGDVIDLDTGKIDSEATSALREQVRQARQRAKKKKPAPPGNFDL